MMPPEELLDVAYRAERWIDSHRHETEHGLLWGLANEVPSKHFHNLYSGSAGIALFYLELFQATNEQRYLDIATQAGLELVHKIYTIDSLPCAMMGGWGGYLFVLNELAAATGNSDMAKAAHYCAQKQRDQATEISDGIGWIQEMPYAKLTGHQGEREIYDVAEGAAGVGLAWLYAHEQNIHDEALSWTVAAADRLLQVSEEAEGGLRWQLMDDIPWPFDAPNFAHGTAGVAFFMARLYEHTQQQKYLDAAIAGAGHVQSMAEDIDGGGHLVPHILNDGRPNRYYLGMCHGPAGTSRLFYLLSEITQDTSWTSWSRGLDDGLLALGAPEKRSKGLWNNISQCCCDAGIGDHAVSQFRSTQDTFYLELAQRVATELVNRSEGDTQQCCWPQAEHRSQPDFIQAQTGYMQGAAGVGSFFIHLATTLADKPVKIAWPDSPYRRLVAS
ncbi:MAG: lanthionine synthetase LanC family protein [Pseudomonadota bacterium]